MRAIFSFILLFNVFTGVFPSYGQTENKSGSHCSSKKWNPTRYRETDGNIYPIDDASKKEYVILKCDGTFESAEDEGRTILTGRWTWNSQKKEITMTANNKVKEYSQVITTKVIKWTDKELVISKRDGGNEEVQIFFTL